MLSEQVCDYLRERIEWAFCTEVHSNVLDSNNVVSGGFGSKCLLPAWAFSQAPVVQAVNKLNKHEKTLVKFVVGLPVEHDEMVYLMVPVWAAFYQGYHAFKRMNATSLPKAQNLLEFALINYKLSVARQPLVKNKDMMLAIGVSDSKTFSRDWNPRLGVMHSVIQKMERDALELVLKSIDEKRKKHA